MKLVADGGNPLQCRVGVNTAEVVTRSIATGDGHAEYTPIGPTTNLASRMRAVAPVGSTAVSESTRKLCEGYFILKPLGPTRVKCVTDLVNVYEVTGMGPMSVNLAAPSQWGGRPCPPLNGPAATANCRPQAAAIASAASW